MEMIAGPYEDLLEQPFGRMCNERPRR
jgi:hypothetical protein